MKKKLLSLLLCASLIWGLASHQAYAKSGRDTSFETSLAEDLKSLGLFKGVSETEFDLDRAPSRIEALVMLIRLLGSEKTALEQRMSHPFTDVPDWADDYVGYAYANGLANGITETEFGTGTANAAMYLTFVLRALGYSDAGGADFSWDSPYALAERIGVLPETVDVSTFWRADAVTISYSALQSNMKNSSQTLASKLIKSGAFTETKFKDTYDPNAFSNQGQATKTFDAQKIYEKCSPSVFCIETYDINGNPIGLGSGFFISENGIAVTNYHVIEGAMSAKILLTNGEIYDVDGLVDLDENLDFVTIVIDGSGFTPLKLGDSSSVKGGESVFAIGNPEGLTNTISDGIISNPCRKDFNDMIQISVPISHGSSGGALINTSGEVIGITTAFLSSGQNLNFAVPINFVKPEGGMSVLESRQIITLAQCTMAMATDPGQGGAPQGNTQQAAFNALRTWIQNNYNTTYSYKNETDLVYAETFPVEEDVRKFALAYNADMDIISAEISETYYGEKYSLFLSISPLDEEFTAYFSDNSSEASCQINPKIFNETSPIVFSLYTGQPEKKDICAELTRGLTIAALEFTEYVLNSFVPGNYSIADLGFISM